MDARIYWLPTPCIFTPAAHTVSYPNYDTPPPATPRLTFAHYYDRNV
jgi:hypothetical protein